MREIFQKYASSHLKACKIIVVQTNSITPSFDRQPSSNTVAYFKLRWDWLDYSWNWNNLSSSWTPSYTTVWNAKYQTLHNSTWNSNYLYKTNASWLPQARQVRTLSVRFYMSWTNSSNDQNIVMFWNDSTNQMFNIYCTINTRNLCVSQYWGTSWTIMTLDLNTRYNIISVYDWTSYQVYVNSVLKKTRTYSINTQWSKIYIMQSPRELSRWYTIWNIANIIIEKVWRNQATITSYFNKVKSQFWL